MRIAIVGTGIIGAAAGFRLSGDGHEITFFERDPLGEPASYGNAGHIGTASVIPWASSTNIRLAFHHHTDTLHPLVLRGSELLRSPRWLQRFFAASRSAQFDATSRALAALLSDADPLIDAMLRDLERPELRQTKGLLHVYLSESSARAAQGALERRRRFGIPVTRLSTGDLFELEPNLVAARSADVVHSATMFPGVSQITSPQAMRNACLSASNARIRTENVLHLAWGTTGVTVQTETSDHSFDGAILAAGVGSQKFLKRLGVDVPIIAERGYHRQFEGSPLIKRSALFVDLRVVASPLADGLRLTTGAEFTSASRPPDHKRMDPIFRKAQDIMGIEDQTAELWSGDRPSTPDSLPIIGPAPRNPKVFVATGHGHIGLTLSGVTAKLACLHFSDNAILEDGPLRLESDPVRPTR